MIEMDTKNIALIEFGGHIECCIYSQLRFLRDSGYRVHLVCLKSFESTVKAFGNADEYHFLDEQSGPIGRIRQVRRIHRYLRANGIGKIVINSFSGEMVKLLLLFARGLDIFGIIHGTEKLSRSRWVRLLSGKVNGFFLLNDHLLQHCPTDIGSIQSLYTIFFPEYPARELPKAEKEFWVCVPGQLEYKRRNYPGLLEELSADLNGNIRFILLGRSAHTGGDGADFRSKIRGNDRFILFDDFVDEPLFHSYIARSDVILPLLGGRARYVKEAISASFNLSFGYRIPMVIEEELMFIEDLQVSAFSFSPGRLVEVLNRLYENRETIREKSREMSEHRKFSYEFQRKAYIRFIENN